jgi:predicted transcriptional regulator
MSTQGLFYNHNERVQSSPVRELKPSSIRIDDEMRKEIERIATLGHVTPADVIRMCVKAGLPTVERAYEQMNAVLEGSATAEKIAQSKKQK